MLISFPINQFSYSNSLRGIPAQNAVDFLKRGFVVGGDVDGGRSARCEKGLERERGNSFVL